MEEGTLLAASKMIWMNEVQNFVCLEKQLSFRAHQKLVGPLYETTLKDGFLGKAPVPRRRLVGYKFFHVDEGGWLQRAGYDKR